MPESESLVRHRVLDALHPGPTNRLVLLVAPAGAGKTTALAQFAQATTDQVAWYRATRTEAEPAAMLEQLERAVRTLVPSLEGPWADVDTATRALASVRAAPRCIVMVDDLHELRHTWAELALRRLVEQLPPWLTFVTASRHEPACDLTDLRVRGLLAAVPSDVLRWRHWEVERLFRDLYHQRLRPEDAAHLTQRTEGWAAGLQLFHLATRELPAGDRHRLIDELHTRPGLVRTYLTHNVLARLPRELQTFLVDTCVLGRLLPELCDELRGSANSTELLDDLVSRRLFTVPCEDGRGYRYHEVLGTYLEISLLRRDGPARARDRFAVAGKLLEGAGSAAEAVRAYARADAWEEVERLLGSDGPELATGTQVERLSENLLAGDPWLELARARALWRDGRFDAASNAYATAEAEFGDASAVTLCQAERTELLPWIDPRQLPAGTAAGLLRAATRRAPRDVIARAEALGSPLGLLVATLGAVLAGDLSSAALRAERVTADPDSDHVTVTAALAIEHVASAGRDGLDRSRLHAAADTFEQLGWTWLARLLQLLADLAGGRGDEEVGALCTTAECYGDPWGPPLFQLLGGVAAVLRHEDADADAVLVAAAAGFRELRAPTLQAWAESWAALAASGQAEPASQQAAQRARSLARRLAVPGAEAIADLAHARITADCAAEEAATATAEALGLPVPARARAAGRPGTGIGCFGGLRLTVDDRDIDIRALKPQLRFLLGRLACPPDTPVPREELIEELWPEAQPGSGLQKLHVAISSLRRFLEPDAERGEWSLVRRTGEAYVLRLPSDARSDVATLDAAVSKAHEARRNRDYSSEAAALRTAFDAYGGDLLPELGTGEWVTEARAQYRSAFAQVAQGMLEHHLAAGDADAGIAAAEAGLRADRYRSRLWEGLAAAHRAAGDPAAAARVEQEHAAVLAELGLPAPSRPPMIT